MLSLSLSLLMYHYHCSFSSLAAKREGHVSICFLRLQSVLQFSNFSIYLMLADAGSALAGASRAKHSGKEITWEKLHSHLASFSWSAEVQLHCLNALRQYLNKNKNMIKYDMNNLLLCLACKEVRLAGRSSSCCSPAERTTVLQQFFCMFLLASVASFSLVNREELHSLKHVGVKCFQVTLFLLFPPSL